MARDLQISFDDDLLSIVSLGTSFDLKKKIIRITKYALKKMQIEKCCLQNQPFVPVSIC